MFGFDTLRPTHQMMNIVRQMVSSSSCRSPRTAKPKTQFMTLLLLTQFRSSINLRIHSNRKMPHFIVTFIAEATVLRRNQLCTLSIRIHCFQRNIYLNVICVHVIKLQYFPVARRKRFPYHSIQHSICFHRPSINRLMSSVVSARTKMSVAVLLIMKQLENRLTFLL